MLKIDMRRRQILELVERDGQVAVSRLSALFDTTPATIRNDLTAHVYSFPCQSPAVMKRFFFRKGCVSLWIIRCCCNV